MVSALMISRATYSTLPMASATVLPPLSLAERRGPLEARHLQGLSVVAYEVGSEARRFAFPATRRVGENATCPSRLNIMRTPEAADHRPRTSLDDVARDKLAALEHRALRRRLVTTDRMGAVDAEQNGAALVSFSCNDYLNLTYHPDVKAAAKAAIEIASDRGVRSASSELADMVDVISHMVERDAGILFCAARPARDDHPIVERRADHAVAFDDGAQLFVVKLSLMLNQRAAIVMARQHDAVEMIQRLPKRLI